MAQIFDPVPENTADPLLCCYVNATSQIQVVRITNITNWYFERVVFPGQRLVFETVRSALLEIHTGMMASAILSDTIPCERLSINEGLEAEDESEPTSEPVPAVMC
ncbi:MAG: DUF1830 domain-containing protein [Jaaginema sp. PMC 1079.18]|nr:DUF1830 domain-containing protein [Jaaginema sp. PMC 1080.18]MEC4852579.1 DUF1830 domain-containing protein [Jaaginema sp. PMC 1079.18]MEC4867993.1 DUF1830 domain-containing protein [Jaaginema sp. PMC 1078.18]